MGEQSSADKQQFVYSWVEGCIHCFCFRKRSRDDEACEFMPLSKRINNLHINNNLACSSAGTNVASSSSHEMQSSHHCPNDLRRPSYDPGVNSSQSPYYNDNKLLFELHLERIQRTGQQFPF